MIKNIIEAIKQKIGGFLNPKIVSPIPEETQTQIPTPTPVSPILRAIQKGFEEYGGKDLPVATLSAVFEKAAKENNLNPYLLPAVSILETSGGRRQAKPNNPLNWGIYEETFQPQTPEETIYKAASGIGTGRRHAPYEEYRRTGNLYDFAKRYAPPTENDTERYVRDLTRMINMFKAYE